MFFIFFVLISHSLRAYDCHSQCEDLGFSDTLFIPKNGKSGQFVNKCYCLKESGSKEHLIYID